MSETVPIKVETLKSFADEARRISGSENELSTTEMLDTFGNAEILNNQDLTITANGVFSPESGYSGFGKVTADFPNAEDAVFGTASGSEYGITSDVTFTSDGATYNNLQYAYTYGYRFTPVAPFALSGFRYCCGTKGTSEQTFELWDASTHVLTVVSFL